MNGLALRVKRMMERLEREDVCMHGLILSVGGEKKAEAYYAPFQEGEPHRMYSISKTMTALAVGMLIGDGKLALDDPIAQYFADWLDDASSEELRRLTIADMLRMATCYERTTYREGIDENWAKTFFTAKPTHQPGMVFHYDTSCSQVLAALVQRLSGMDALTFLKLRLFDKIGATDEMRWLCDPSGCCQGGTGLCMSLRDLHRTARVVMEGGHGLIPEWFCRQMGEKHIETVLQANEEECYGYGWQCWRTRAGWAMYGLGGQLAVCCPEHDALLCTIADTRLDPFGVQRIYNAFFEEVYPYIGVEDMPYTVFPASVHALENHGQHAIKHAGPYLFAEGNPLGLRTVELCENTLWIENERGKNPMRFGVGQNAQGAFPGWPDVPTLCSGGWLAEGLLRVRCYVVGQAPCGVDMLLRFEQDRLTIQSRKSFDPVTNAYEGVATGVKRG